MKDTEEDWQDPLLDVSIPYNSLAPYALTCYQLDEDLQDLISFFSTLRREDLAYHINETSFESKLRILKNVLLVQPGKLINSRREPSYGRPENSEGLNKNIGILNAESKLKLQRSESSATDSGVLDPLNSDIRIADESVAGVDMVGSGQGLASSQAVDGAVQVTNFTQKMDCNSGDNMPVDNSNMLMTFFKELEAAKLFENLESFSGILAAHSIHLRILQNAVSDIFKVEELRLRLCSQLAALLNPIILSRLESYNNSLFFTAFTVPSSDCSSVDFQGGSNSLPNPIIYKWPSNSVSIEDYKLYMSRLPLLCFSEVFKLGSCINEFLRTDNNQKVTGPNDEQSVDFSDIYADECSVRIKSIESICDHENGPQMDYPLFHVDYGTGCSLNTNSNSAHHPLCTDIAQDSKDIERDVIYVNGKEYSGANGGYERIVFIVAGLVESYWLKFSDVHTDIDVDAEKEGFSNDTCKNADAGNVSVSNPLNRDVNETYEDRNTDSVIIATILLHILSRTFSGGACFDKVSLVYNKPDCIVISPNSKRARPLEMLILPNIALMLSTLRFRLYEVMDNLTVNTQPCFLVDTHVVSRLVPDSGLIESLPYYSFHTLSRTPVGKIPRSIYHHLIKSANLFLSNHIIFTRIKITKKMDNDVQLESHEKAEDDTPKSKIDKLSEDFKDPCEKSSNVQSDKEVDQNNQETVICNNKCLDTDKIIEVTGDDLTIITPGEAALFRMFTNIHDKDAAHNSMENVNLSNSEVSTNKEAIDDRDRYDHETNSNASIKEETKGGEAELHCSQLTPQREKVTPGSPSLTSSGALSAQVKTTCNFGLEDHKEIFHPIDDNYCVLQDSNSIKDQISNNNPLDYLGSGQITSESKENNEHKDSSFYLEFSNQQSNKDVPKLYFYNENIDFPDSCCLTSNIYIASSENSPNLASDLSNLPADSIGAIDQENQQLVHLLQSRRVISQFGIFNIINT
ncbi:hypothetical protein OJ252_2446 [Cryptosporidium canis]|uniref:Uncharacterized protein n=1 Tax=Cryptosporidium canis TaxID=195482 RepID=A0ABQ8P570_9CRYT|nr:hypothetical protein OJ252_2446 [Cryptosporidium canis]